MTRSIALAAILLLVPGAALSAQEERTAHDPLTARAELIDRDGNPAGHVVLTQTPHNVVLLKIEAWGLEPGVRAIHIHETGQCDPPGFGSAGGHFNPIDAGHGAMHQRGMHVGDLLNLHVPADGRVVTERFAIGATLRRGEPTSLLGGDGTAIVIHASADDYRTQPTGDAGGRVVCGVIVSGS
jgi:superoxide dismutase, Cu-Zn family